jgi:hypothetical protein
MSKSKHQKPKRFRKKTVETAATRQARHLRHMHASVRRRYLEAFDITAAGTVQWPA